jgi:hypothetical protein
MTNIVYRIITLAIMTLICVAALTVGIALSPFLFTGYLISGLIKRLRKPIKRTRKILLAGEAGLCLACVCKHEGAFTEAAKISY